MIRSDLVRIQCGYKWAMFTGQNQNLSRQIDRNLNEIWITQLPVALRFKKIVFESDRHLDRLLNCLKLNDLVLECFILVYSCQY